MFTVIMWILRGFANVVEGCLFGYWALSACHKGFVCVFCC